MRHQLDRLRSYYRMVVVETDSESGFYEKVAQVDSKYGKISLMVIGAHGTSSHINLGWDWWGLGYDKYNIDLSDEEELRKMVAHHLAEHPTIVLQACSSGKDERSIGAMISKALNAKVYAPENPSAGSYVFNQHGISDVKYFGELEEVHKDGTITIRYDKPSPSNVFLEGKIASRGIL